MSPRLSTDAPAGLRNPLLDPVLGEKRREVRLSRLVQNRQIAAVDRRDTEHSRCPNEVAKVGIQLRRPAGDVDELYPGSLHECDDRLHDLARHLLGARRPRVHVTVQARLVAAVAQIDLQGIQTTAPYGREIARLEKR